MGKLSDWFGAGAARDRAQDARINELAAKVLALEAAPGSSVDITGLTNQVNELGALALAINDRVTTIAADVANLGAREVVDQTARSALAANATAFQNINQRLAVIEEEFASLPADPSGGITVPEINP